MRWDSVRNTFVDDGGASGASGGGAKQASSARAPASAEAPPERPEWARETVSVVHTVGSAVLAAYGLSPLAKAAGDWWREQGFID